MGHSGDGCYGRHVGPRGQSGGFVATCQTRPRGGRPRGAATQSLRLGIATTWIGDLAGGAALAAETESVAAATGSHFPPFTLLRLRSLQGREAESSP